MSNQDNTDDLDITTHKLGKYVVEMFPEGYILLNKELATGLHSALERKLNLWPPDEIDLRLSIIAVHCDIILDGVYDLKSRSHLCAVLAGRLEVLRELPPPQTILM